ncbi:hypothetical protein FV228_07280 [Methylobacterium sp. WL18]|uniref:hypothetical protein n=1 Tax=Methylobacterium sp. WL18 TaxID=2603897 RepID=UPI0011C950B3|nr:hypothetical protein [Methylobacterium sp. WL18]TXN73855.1 hypothetical protein FV228_07280 [Methylobacterium sp. WL18]
MTDTPQHVPIERVNWVRRDGGELVVNLVTMGRSLALGFGPEAAQALLDGIVTALREQVDEAIPAPSAAKLETDNPAKS